MWSKPNPVFFKQVLTVSLMAILSSPAYADGMMGIRGVNRGGNTSYPSSYNSTYNTGNGSSASFNDYRSTASAGRQSFSIRGQVTSIPKGTMMVARLDQPLSSFSNNLGDSFTATLENDMYVNDTVVLPAGSEILGQVANVNKSGRLGRHGDLDVRFLGAKTPDGMSIPLHAHAVTSDQTGVFRGNTYSRDLLKGVGYAALGTGTGALLGTATGGILGAAGSGAVVGTGVGAIAGISYALARQGKDVVIPSGSRLSLVVDQSASVSPNF
jgi:hypothetical protein